MLDSDIKEQIRFLVDPVMLLEMLGFVITKRSDREIRAACAIHGGDNPTAFRMSTETKRFSCYSHKCEMTGDSVDNDIFALVMKVKRVGFREALCFLADMVGVNPDDVSFKEAREKALARKYVSSSVNEVKSLRGDVLPEIDRGVADKFLSEKTDYFTDMGVSPEVQEFFEIGSMVDSHGIRRATIPIRDVNGKLVSVSARRIDSDTPPRYLLLKDFKKHAVLYNLHNAISVYDAFGFIIVVEGFKAAWAVHSSGFPNVVASMGALVLEPQAALLASSGVNRCVLMLDGDDAGKDGSSISISRLNKYLRSVDACLYEYFYGMSPDDFPPSVLSDIVADSVKRLGVHDRL